MQLSNPEDALENVLWIIESGVCVVASGGFPDILENQALDSVGRERLKEEADHSRLAVLISKGTYF